MKIGWLVLFIGLLLFTLGCQPIRATTPTPSVVADPLQPLPVETLPLTNTGVITAAVNTTATLTLAATPPVTGTAAPLADGRTLYRQYYCGICHQSTGAGTTGTFGPSHDGLAVSAAQHLHAPTYQGDATTLQEYLYESLVDPQRFVVPGYEWTLHRMPSYRFLTPAELATLVAWLQQQ